MKLKTFLGPLLITLILLIVIEAISSIFTKEDIPFFWNVSLNLGIPQSIINPKNGFDEVDPLLGYARTEESMKKRGFNIENECTVLANTADTSNTVNIFITGGSTTDLGIDSTNWPIELYKIFAAHGINAKIYNGGTGGYNSGQEFLKLVRDGLSARPYIHISYSGANDWGDQSYICSYESSIFESILNKSPYAPLMPRTTHLLKRLWGQDVTKISLHHRQLEAGAPFWIKNMHLMKGTASEYNYHFLGVLQPVLGSGQYQQKMSKHDPFIQECKQRYPLMKDLAQKHPEYIADLSGIFDTCRGSVYRDNCHIEAQYQHLVAENIYNELMRRKMLDK